MSLLEKIMEGNPMESIKLSFQAVMPIFILMLIGFLIKKFGLLDQKSNAIVNKLVFKIFLPVLLFYNIYSAKTNFHKKA